jgi:RNA polymerase sigma factor (sigma-70 family)
MRRATMGEKQATVDRQWIYRTFVEHEGPLLRYALGLLQDLDAARDVVQEAFLKLCRQERGCVEKRVSAWLFTVCRRGALDVIRRRKRMVRSSESEQKVGASDVADPLDVLAKDETTRAVLAALNDLPINQQEIVRLRFQNEFSYREISKITGLSESNVGYLLHTAIKKLREKTR